MKKSDAPPATGKAEAAFWNAVKEGDFVSLSDFRALSENGGQSLDCRVLGVRDLAVRDSYDGRPLARCRLLDLEGPAGTALWFLVLSAGSDFELRVYRAPAEFRPGSRDALIDAEQTWLFLPPADPEDFHACDLELAPYPDAPAFAEEGGAAKRVWEPAGFGVTVYGDYERGGDEVPVLLREYKAEEADAPDPHLLVLEERWLDRERERVEGGGLVSVFLGRSLDVSHADVFPGDS